MVNFFLCFALHFALLLCCFAALLFISFYFFGVTFWPALYNKFVSQFLLLLLLLLLLPFAAVNTRHVQPPDQTIIIIIIIVIVIVFQARETRRCFRYTFGKVGESTNKRTNCTRRAQSVNWSQPSVPYNAQSSKRSAPTRSPFVVAVAASVAVAVAALPFPNRHSTVSVREGRERPHEREHPMCCCYSSFALTL